MPRLARSALCALSCALLIAPCLAQDGEALQRLGLRQPDADLPGVGRVLLVLALTIALGVAAIYALRRFWPLTVPQRSGGPVKVSAQLAVSSTLKLHFVELGDATLVVAEGRGGLAIVELKNRASVGEGAARAEHAG